MRQDQRADYLGLRASVARSSDIHAFKTGIDVSRENYADTGFIQLAGNAGRQSSDVAQGGTLFGAYVQDRWALGQRFAINSGLRFDHSTGFVGGSQLSPRLEVNYSFDRATVFHAYAGRLYAAPSLEDTRRDAIVTQTTADANPPYDLKPERDSYVEFGLAHTFHPGFSMYAEQARPYSLAAQRGHPVVLFFGYTHCPDACPTTLAHLAQAVRLPNVARDVRVGFVTVDPARDSAPLLGRYVRLFDPHFVGLTGSSAALRSVYSAYHVWRQPVHDAGTGESYAVGHSTTIYYIGRDGSLRAFGRWDDDAAAIARALRELG